MVIWRRDRTTLRDVTMESRDFTVETWDVIIETRAVTMAWRDVFTLQAAESRDTSERSDLLRPFSFISDFHEF